MVDLKPNILEDLKEVQLSSNHLEWTVKIETIMDPQIRFVLINTPT